MIKSVYEKHWLIVDEQNIEQIKEESEKIHIIKLFFDDPTNELVEETMDRFPSTNRFVICDNIRFYNNILKMRKKYYIENTPEDGLISFFKKNNKVLLNIENLNDGSRLFVEENIRDILRNVEVVQIPKESEQQEEWIKKIEKIRYWNGNILVR